MIDERGEDAERDRKEDKRVFFFLRRERKRERKTYIYIEQEIQTYRYKRKLGIEKDTYIMIVFRDRH